VKALRWLTPLLVLLAIAPFVVLARYAEPSYDDWCLASRVRELGYWGGVSWWCQHWAGRFTAILAWNVVPISNESLAGYRLSSVLLLLALFAGAFALWRAEEPAAQIVAQAGATDVVAEMVQGAPIEDAARSFARSVTSEVGFAGLESQ